MSGGIKKLAEDFLYLEKALGKAGEEISVYKIRTMVRDADEKLEEVILQYGLDDTGRPKYDPRITGFGKVLRKYWIDEVPQIINFLKGEMQLVGVRPKTEKYWENYPTEFKEKALKQKPGLIPARYIRNGVQSFEELVEIENELLDRLEENHARATIEYTLKTAYNIMFKRIRSR